MKLSKVVIYRKHPKRENDFNRRVLESLCQYFESSGIDYSTCTIQNSAKRMGERMVHGEVGIVYGIPKYCRKDCEGMDKLFELQKNMIVLERGFVKRDKYHSIGWGSMNGYADFKNVDSPPNRGENLKVGMTPWRTKGRDIVITGQVPWDSNVQNLYLGDNRRSRREVSGAYISWLKSTFDGLKDMGFDKEIVFRPHPYLKEMEKDFLRKYEAAIPLTYWSNNQKIEKDLGKAKCLITYNSNSAVDAVINGIPVIVSDKGSMAWDVANHSISDLEDLKTPDRRLWLYDLAYSQWSDDEIKKGLFWKHLVGDRK